MGEIRNHYETTFTSDNPDLDSEILNCVPTQINKEMNMNLTMEVSNEKVWAALFQLGSARWISRVILSKELEQLYQST